MKGQHHTCSGAKYSSARFASLEWLSGPPYLIGLCPPLYVECFRVFPIKVLCLIRHVQINNDCGNSSWRFTWIVYIQTVCMLCRHKTQLKDAMIICTCLLFAFALNSAWSITATLEVIRSVRLDIYHLCICILYVSVGSLAHEGKFW